MTYEMGYFTIFKCYCLFGYKPIKSSRMLLVRMALQAKIKSVV